MRSPSRHSAPFRPRSARSPRLLAVLAALLVLAGLPGPHASGQTAAETAGGESAGVWDLGVLRSGKVYPTSVTAQNVSCQGSHTFHIDVVDAPWLLITGPNPLREIPLGEQRTTDARVDLRGVAAGEYRGRLRFECTTCPPPPVCALDRYEMEVRLKVKDPPRLEILDAPRIYFQDQTVDRLITFRLRGPEEMTVTELTAIWEPMKYTCRSRRHEIPRTRPEATPVNTTTYFRLQESRLEELAVMGCPSDVEPMDSRRPLYFPVAAGRWRLRAVVSLADGVETVESVDLCRSEEGAWLPCVEPQARTMLLVREDAAVLEVGCDRSFRQILRVSRSASGEVMGGVESGPRPPSTDALRLNARWTTLRIPLASGEMAMRMSYGEPFYPGRRPADHTNPELQVGFHVAPGVDAVDLPRSGLKIPARAQWDWSKVKISLTSHYDPHYWSNWWKGRFEDVFLGLATAGFGGAPAGIRGIFRLPVHTGYLFGASPGGVVRVPLIPSNARILDTLARLISEGPWQGSISKAYGGYEFPPWLEHGAPESGEREFLFFLYNAVDQEVGEVTEEGVETWTLDGDVVTQEVEAKGFGGSEFHRALSGEMVLTAPALGDAHWPHLRFFLGGVAAVGVSNRKDQTRSAEVEIERLRPDLAPIRFDFGERALHESCPAFDPPPAPDLDPTFLEIARPAIERPTQVVPAEDGS